MHLRGAVERPRAYNAQGWPKEHAEGAKLGETAVVRQAKREAQGGNTPRSRSGHGSGTWG